MHQTLLIVVSTLSGAMALAVAWILWSFLCRPWRDWRRRSENGERPKIKLDIKRAFWPLVAGNPVMLLGSIEVIRAIDNREFLSLHSWFIVMMLGALLVVWGAKRGLKIN